MQIKLYVANLSKSTTEDELNELFAQAGQVTATEVIKDRKSGESQRYAFVTMSVQSEAEKAVSMFNAYSFGERTLKVALAIPRAQHDITAPIFEP